MTARCSPPRSDRRFDLEHVSRNPARFDEVKLRWLNGVYTHAAPDELAHGCGFLRDRGTPAPARTSASRARWPSARRKIHTLATSAAGGPLLDGPGDDPRAPRAVAWETGRATLARGSRCAGRRRELRRGRGGAALQAIVARRGSSARCYQPLRVAIFRDHRVSRHLRERRASRPRRARSSHHAASPRADRCPGSTFGLRAIDGYGSTGSGRRSS